MLRKIACTNPKLFFVPSLLFALAGIAEFAAWAKSSDHAEYQRSLGFMYVALAACYALLAVRRARR
jgi:tryptophan-rich sensory protein